MAIDMDAVDRRAWDKPAAQGSSVLLTWLYHGITLGDRLGEPDDGESLKQVGKDPAREYQVRCERATKRCSKSVLATCCSENARHFGVKLCESQRVAPFHEESVVRLSDSPFRMPIELS